MGEGDNMQVDIAAYASPHGWAERARRAIWDLAWLLLFRPSPRPLFAWRRLLLRLFGARIGRGVKIYPSCRIWAPWNLTMDIFSNLADDVNIYCVAPIAIGAHSTVSQYSFLCAASHDYEDPRMPLVTSPITIGDQVWVCADVFVAPGVRVGQGAVVGARSSVFKDIPPWTVAGGSPAKVIKQRTLRRNQDE